MQNERKPDRTYDKEEFAFGMMWGVKGHRALSVLKPDDVVLAVNKAYLDMIQHNVPGLSLKTLLNDVKCGRNSPEIANRNAIFERKKERIDGLKCELAEIIADVFRTKKFDDDIHNTLCNFFVKSFKEIVEELNNRIRDFSEKCKPIEKENVHYGLAQKIVNMTFKYLYLFDDASEDPDYEKNIFEKCHMPLDSYVLNYLKKTEKLNITNTPWSKLNEKEYLGIQKKIFNHFAAKEGEEKYPFFAEFYIFSKATDEQDQ